MLPDKGMPLLISAIILLIGQAVSMARNFLGSVGGKNPEEVRTFGYVITAFGVISLFIQGFVAIVSFISGKPPY
jgi:phage-related protein